MRQMKIPHSYAKLWLCSGQQCRMVLTLLCFLLASLSVSAHEPSAKTISLKFDNAPMSKVLTKIEDKTGYKMDFTYDEIQSYKVTVNVKNVTVDEAMKAVLRGTPFGYSISGKFITVFRSKPNQVKMSSVEPTRKIIGRVLDENGDPVIGANVYDKDNRRHAAVTDNDGAFTIFTPPQCQTVDALLHWNEDGDAPPYRAQGFL